MYKIRNVHESKAFNILKKTKVFIKQMSDERTEQIYNVREYYDRCLIIQPPYQNSANRKECNDFSYFDKAAGLDFRLEIKSLDPRNSVLGDSIIRIVKESKLMPEKLLILLLIGDGFDEINRNMIVLRETIEQERLHVTVMRSFEQLESYLKSRYQNLK